MRHLRHLMIPGESGLTMGMSWGSAKGCTMAPIGIWYTDLIDWHKRARFSGSRMILKASKMGTGMGQISSNTAISWWWEAEVSRSCSWVCGWIWLCMFFSQSIARPLITWQKMSVSGMRSVFWLERWFTSGFTLCKSPSGIREFRGEMETDLLFGYDTDSQSHISRITISGMS